MDKVVIMRGPSGFGKSTHAKENFPDYAVTVSADDFWWRKFVGAVHHATNPTKVENGSTYEYVFNPYKLGEAHADCMRRFLLALKDGKEPSAPENAIVILDNTSIKKWEYAHYVEAASLGGYAVEVHEPDVANLTVENIREMHKRGQHSVPYEIIFKQCMEFEPDPNAIIIPFHK